jgi:3-hydroxy-D-aspartate aldolase
MHGASFILVRAREGTCWDGQLFAAATIVAQDRFGNSGWALATMQSPPAEIGASVEEIDTPALIIDLDAFERNLAKMMTIARKANVAVRPHAKTHKCPEIARRQIALGAAGQCVQKVGEAEALCEAGIADILVSNEIVGDAKLRRLARLAERATIGLCFDAPEQVDAASRVAREHGIEFGALVEIEVGMERCGIPAGAPARDLARRITDAPNLRFEGLQAYHGRAQHLPTVEERRQAIDGAVEAVRTTLQALSAAGLPCARVTGAGTGTFRLEAASGVYNELQVGSYIFMDTDYARIAGEDGAPYREFEHSLFVLSTVMSLPTADRGIMDAGLKSFSAEKGLPWMRDAAGLEVVGVSDEHAKLRVGPAAPELRLGAKLMMIPGHCDPTVNLHDWYVGVRRGYVEALWPITARGASR